MILTYNASNFVEWFWTQVISIIGQLYNLLDEIEIANNVSLFDLIIWVVIIGIIAKIVITAPGDKQIIRASKRKGE